MDSSNKQNLDTQPTTNLNNQEINSVTLIEYNYNED